MGRRRRSRLSQGESGSFDFSICLEEQVDQLLWLSKRHPEAAFSHRLCGPQGTRYIPCHTLELLTDLHNRGLATHANLHARNTFMASLDTHFSSSPTRPPKHVIYFRDPNNRFIACHGFCTLAASLGFINEVLQYLPGHDSKWAGPQKLDINNGELRIESADLEDIMECQSPISIPYPYTAFAARITGHSNESFTKNAQPKAVKRIQTDVEAPAGPRKRRSAEETLIDTATMALRLDISPSSLRRLLRKSGLSKPYEWSDGEEADATEAKLRGML